MRNLLLYLFIGLSLNSFGQLKELTLEQAVMQQWRAFYPEHSLMVKWIPGTENYTYLSADYQTLKMGYAKKKKVADLITTSELNAATEASFSYVNVVAWKDENFFYTTSNNTYYLINVGKKTGEKITSIPENAENATLCVETGNVAYTIDNNLYFAKGEEQIQVTNFEPHIVSGQAIARSEFGITNGIFWSPEGKKLGFYQKDESKVADYPLLDISTATGSLKSIKYPMAGQDSEMSAAGVYDLATGKTIYVKPTGDAEDYLTNFAWDLKGDKFYLAEVNRDQNHMKFLQCDAQGKTTVLFEEKNDKWVEPENPAYFVSDDQFVWMSERDGFMNLYLYNTKGDLLKQLTSNQWVASGIVGDDSKGNVYFYGTGKSPLDNQYFSVNITTAEQKEITKEAGTHDVQFSSDFTYAFDAYDSRQVPNRELILEIDSDYIREIRLAEDPYKGYDMGLTEFGTIKAGDGTTDLHYRMIKPGDFDATKKYPVLVYVYGGPHAQLVTNSWLGGASLWMYWMAQQGYIVYTVDGRGSANRGFEFESVIHRQLGTAEMEDQLKGVEFLKSLSFVDANRLAVHGWSFGGFMTTSLMLRNAGVFNVGVAGGPVTDWSYYEVMYGERYMDRPDQNKEGYKTARLMNYVENLKGKLMLIHGTVDDVVVMQHNYRLVQEFVSAGVQMDFFPYPMHKHNVYGKDRVHLMEKILTYIIENNQAAE